jgi:hypothetical protein
MAELYPNSIAHYKQNQKLIEELVESVILHHASSALKYKIANILEKHVPLMDEACYVRGCPCYDPFEEKPVDNLDRMSKPNKRPLPSKWAGLTDEEKNHV